MGAFDTMFRTCTSQVLSLYPLSLASNWSDVSNFCGLLTGVVSTNHKTTGVLDFEDITPLDVGWWVNGVMCTAVACLPLLLNMVSFWVFTRGSSRSPTHLLLAIVSGLDLLTCAFQLPLQVYVYLLDGYRQLPTRSWCDIYNYLYNFVPAALHSAAFLLNMCLSVQRCVGVKDVRLCGLKTICSYKGTLIAIAVSSTLSATVHALYPITLGVEDVKVIGKEMLATGKLRYVQSCRVSPRHPESYDSMISAYIWARVIILQTIPAVVLGVCNTALIAASFRTYSYRRRLIGRLGAIASLRDSCAPDLEAFKKFSDNHYGSETEKKNVCFDNHYSVTKLHSEGAETGLRRRSLNAEKFQKSDAKKDRRHSELYSREAFDLCKFDNVESKKKVVNEFVAVPVKSKFSSNDLYNEETSMTGKETGDRKCRDTVGNSLSQNNATSMPWDIDGFSWRELLREHFLINNCKSDFLIFEKEDEGEKDDRTGAIVSDSYSVCSFDQNHCIANCDKISSPDNLDSTSRQIKSEKLRRESELYLLTNIGTGKDSLANVMCRCDNVSGQNMLSSGSTANPRRVNVLLGMDDFIYSDKGLSKQVTPFVNDSQQDPAVHAAKKNVSLMRTVSTWPLLEERPGSDVSMVVGKEIAPPSSDLKEPCSGEAHTNNSASASVSALYSSRESADGSKSGKLAAQTERPRTPNTNPGSGELRSTVMLVLVTSFTLLAEVFVIVMLVFQFIDSVAMPKGKFISKSQLAVLFSLSNLVTLLTFPLNFFIFCGLSHSFREALRDSVRTVLAIFGKIFKRT